MDKSAIVRESIAESSAQWPPPSTAIEFAAFQAWLDANPTLLSTPGCITWELNGERLLILGWPRAILMQVAHPMIAAGVSQHSVFSQSPTAKLQRFMRTQEQMLRLTYGTPYQVWQAARHIDQIHGRVNGQTADHQRYTARYPELLKWVHATFVDSADVFAVYAAIDAGGKGRLRLQSQHHRPFDGRTIWLFPGELGAIAKLH